MKKFVLKFINWILAAEARKVIRIHQPFVIGITGTVGKSSTKEAVFQIMHDQFGDKVRKNYGSLNAEIGLPLTILGYDKLPSKVLWPVFLVQAYFRTFQKDYPKYLILEMGVENKGDIAYFGTITKLDIAIITSTEGAHLTNFKSLPEYQAEKASIINEVKEGGTVIANYDDSALKKINFKKTISYALLDHKADFYAENITPSLTGTEYRICSVGQKIAIKSKLLGSQFVASALPAFIVGHLFEIQSLKIKKSLEGTKPLNGRMRLLEGKDGCVIIDDTYNSNPVSAKAAFEVLSEIKYSGRKVIIFGNMNELGQFEAEGHRGVGEFSRGKADLLIFVGKNAELMARGNGGLKNILTFPNRQELVRSLDKLIRPRDLILIKASQNGNYFEEVSKALMKNPGEAPKLLVRQNRLWMKKKHVNR